MLFKNTLINTRNYYPKYPYIPTNPNSDNDFLNANSSTAQYLYSMNLYDRNGRVVKIVKTNYINGADIYDNSYNFVGELTTTKRTVYINNNFSSSNLVIQTNINYDRMGRKTGTKMIINNGSEVQTDSLEYNELGQLKTKRLHVNNDAGLEAINYAYNPRGWLTKAEGNYFKQKLYYDEIINNSTPQYNGNISVQTWGNNYSNQEKYYYDKLNRLTTYTNNSNNNETISYADKIGNIAKIIRAGSINETIIFSYIGNKIKRANNFEYFYNENGSVLNNGNIIISGYNELNLPNNISKTHASIFFTYNAKGEKVFKNEVGKEYRIYDDGLEFTRKNITEPYVLDIIKFEEGYIQNATNNFNFYYNLKDHIGNTRVSFMVNPNNVGNINQSIDYYAFGKVRIQGESAIKYLFNGNEYQTGLDVFDFNARTYDPTTGRFLQVDPNVEDGEQLGFNPYHFSFNNPIRFIDPDRMEAEDWVQRKDGSIYWDNNANDQASTKAGETYLGKTLTFNFKSFIDKNLWDGPLGSLTAGEKLNSTITYTGIENEAGELTNISATKNSSPGPTLAGKARDYFPGLGNDQNKFGFSKNSNSLNLIFEQHASVSEFEEYGLNFMGYDIVNVAQQLDIKLTRNNLSISAGTDIFPSATLSMNGIELFKYNQPSFKGTHGRNYNFSDNGVGGVNIISTSRRTTPTIYNRFKN